jgi:hypothetical protein
MAEYAGYVPNKSIDWSGIAKGLQDNIDKGLQERKKKIDEDKKLFDDTKKKLGEYQNTQSPSYNTKAYQLTSEAREYLSGLDKKLKNGEITRDDYKINTNNLYDQYDSFINTSKQFDQYVTSVNEIKNSGKASAEFMAKANANIAFMGLSDGTAGMQIDGNGNIYVSKDGSPISIKQWTNLQNLANTRVDVNAEIAKFTDKVADVVRSTSLPSGASITTEDSRQMKDQYDAIKNNAIANVANRNNPSSIVSILMDNSDLGYQIFMSNNDIKKSVDNAIQKQELANGENVSLTDEQKQKIKSDIESKAIIYTMSGDGSLNPTLTDKMIVDAEKVAGEFFEAQIDSKITEEAARVYRDRGDDDGDGGDENSAMVAGYKSTLRAFGIDENEVRQGKTVYTGNNDFSGLSRSYQYKKVPKGIAIYKTGNIIAKGDETGETADFIAINPRDLAQYVYGGQDIAKSQIKYEKARQIYLQGASPKGGNNPAGNKPAAPAQKAPR